MRPRRAPILEAIVPRNGACLAPMRARPPAEQDPSLPAHLRFGHELDEQCEPGLHMGAATATGVGEKGRVTFLITTRYSALASFTEDALPSDASTYRLDPTVAACWSVGDREAVDLQQFLDAALRVEPLLVGLACLVAVNLVLLGVRLDVRNGKAQRGWVAGVNSTPSTPGVMSSVNDPWPAAMGATPAAMASTATRPNVSSQADVSRTARAREMNSAHRSLLTVPVISTEAGPTPKPPLRPREVPLLQ